jgi:putative ABC transport system permease protein
MSGLWRDLREAWRGLLHQRAFSAAALIMLSLGIAASSAIFAVVQAVVLKMPFDEPDRIVAVRAAVGRDVLFATIDHFEAWRQATDVFESVAAYTLVSPVLTDGDDAALRLQAEAMTASMFAVLGVQPALGRTFRDDEPAVAVLSHTFWRTRFSADPAVLLRPILLDGIPTTVVGVMPAGFDGPRSRPGDIWLPLMPRRPAGSAGVSVLARLAPGVDRRAAQARLESMPWDAGGKTRWTARLDTAREDFLLAEAMEQVRILGGAVAVVLLMACVNVASLLLGRNISRRRELAVRLAIGANRWHIIRYMAVESLLLSAGAAAFGLLLAWWMVAAIVPLIPGSFPRIGEIRVDVGVAAFAALAASVMGIAVSIWPAWSASRQELADAMKSGERGNSGGARRARTALVVLEATLAMIVLTGAALLVGSFLRLNPTSPGFEIADRTKFSVRFAGPRYRDRAARLAAVEELVARLRAVPGVTAASSVTSLPLTGSSASFPYRVVGAPVEQRPPTVHFRAALPDYLTLMGMSIVAGRDLSPSDGAAALPIAVVNEAFVARLLRGHEPLGAEISIDEPDGAVVRRVVGIVRDARIFGNDLRSRPEVFVPYAQSPLTLASFVVRTSGGASAEAGIRGAVASFDATLPVDRVQTLRAVAERSVTGPRFFALLMGAFAVVAVALAFCGLYAVAAWSVTQRTREIGVRLALGATPAAISRMVLRYGVTVGITGAVVGSASAFALTKVIESYLYGFPARQPALIGAIGLSFVLVVTLASYVPARRAMRVDPMEALRME